MAVPRIEGEAYYLMSIHDHLPPQARKDPNELGWPKGLELAKVARAGGSILIVQLGCARSGNALQHVVSVGMKSTFPRL